MIVKSGLLSGWISLPTLPDGREACSLIIPTFKRKQKLIHLLQCLADIPDFPHEVIVVDGTPGRDVEAPLEDWLKTVDLPYCLKYIRTPTGLTLQRNIGLDACQGNIIFFLDDDCVPLPGYFDEINQVFKNDISGEVGAVCGSLINEMGKPLALRWRIRMAIGLVPKNGESGKYYPTATSLPRSLVSPFSGVHAVDIVPGGAVAYRHEIFDDLRFSEFFQGYSQGEDVEMSRRIARTRKLLWCGDAHAIHSHASDGRPNAYKKGRMEVYNRFFIWRRYTPNPNLQTQVQFWLDILLLIVFDFSSFIFHPLQLPSLEHAIGILKGIFECIFVPPMYLEPEIINKHRINFETREF